MARLTIGRLARLCGVNLETVRYYERRGLLPKPPRTEAGYRQFSPDAAQRLRFIKRAQELGFSLEEIRELLAMRIDPQKDCFDVQQFAKAKVAHIEEKIQILNTMKGVLNRLAARCSGCGPIDECPILESIEAVEMSQ